MAKIQNRGKIHDEWKRRVISAGRRRLPVLITRQDVENDDWGKKNGLNVGEHFFPLQFPIWIARVMNIEWFARRETRACVSRETWLRGSVVKDARHPPFPYKTIALAIESNLSKINVTLIVRVTRIFM